MLPAIDFRHIRAHQGSRHRGFEELCFQLLPDLVDLSAEARIDRHGTPDGGVEFVVALPDGAVHGWQAKYLFAFGPNELAQLDKSVKAALDSQPNLSRYTFCLPYNRPAGSTSRAMSAMQRWHRHREKWERWAADRGMRVAFDYMGESELLAALNRPHQVARVYYWFDITVLTPEWFRARLAEAIHHAGPRYTQELHVDLPIAFYFEGLGRTKAFQDRLRSRLREVRDSRRWYALRGLREDSEVKARLEPVERLLDETDRLVMGIDLAGAGPIDLQGVGTTCAGAADSLRAMINWLDERRRASRAAEGEERKREADDLLSASIELRRTIQTVRELGELAGGDAGLLIQQPTFLLTGEPGTGKTHLFCDVARSRVDAGRPTLILFGQHFGPGHLWGQVLEQLGLTCTPDEFLGILSVAAETAGCRALLMIDALNEAEPASLWRDQLSALLAKVVSFPWLGIAVSCRNSYMPVVLPAELQPDRLLRVEHTGFAERTHEAVRVFFDHFHLVRPDFPLIVPELQNPLLLKLLCRGLAEEGQVHFPRGATAVTKLFSRFLDAVERTLAEPDRCDYAFERRLVRKCVTALASAMLRQGREWLPFEVALALTDEILTGRDWSRSLLAGLLAEGVVMKDFVHEQPSDGGEIIRFAYQRLGDHARAGILCDDGIEAVIAALSAMAAEPGGLDWQSSLLEALAIQLPERFGNELHRLVEDALTPSVQRAYLSSIVWRSPQAFPTDLDVEYLNQIHGSVFSNPVLDTLLEVACVPGHPFNAHRLHRNLWSRSMPERDTWWTAYLLYSDEAESSIRRLIEWAWNEDTSTCSDEAALLAATALAWCLASSNRWIRDGATRALVGLLRGRPTVLREVLAKFHGVNDPYVAERLYAVAYGCVLVWREIREVEVVAQQVYRQVFAAGEPPTHILLRDYARGVLEWAWQLGCPMSGVDPAIVRPPYKSPWPLRVSKARYDEEPEHPRDDPYATIRFSVMTWDFHRYVIHSAVREFAAPNQPRLRRETRRLHQARMHEAYETFLGSLTHEQRVAAEMLSPEDEAGQERFIESLSPEQQDLLNSYLSLTYQRETTEVIPFDTDHASRWIFHRVLRLGWTPARFAQLDDLIKHDSHSSSRLERIGKKYQWIAFHELLAILADHCFLNNRWRDEPLKPFSGPWDLAERDLDPSLLLRSMPGQKSPQATWWIPNSLSFGPVRDDEAIVNWLKNLEECPSPVRLVEVTDPEQKRWIVLEGHYSWEEPVPPELDSESVDRRRLWYQFRSYLVRKQDLPRFLRWAKQQRWYGRWMPESRSFSEVFLGEYPWHPAASEVIKDWDLPSEEKIPSPVIVTTAEYSWSKSDISKQGLVPSVPLVRDLELHWSGNGFEYADKKGGIIALAPGIDSSHLLLICPGAMASYLDRQGYALVWTLLGEKLVIGPSLRAGDPYGRAEIDGVLILRGNKVEEVSLRLHFVAPGESRTGRPPA